MFRHVSNVNNLEMVHSKNVFHVLNVERACDIYDLTCKRQHLVSTPE